MRDNHSATRSKDNAKMAQGAQDFDDIIRAVISLYCNADAMASVVKNRSAKNNLDVNSVTAQLWRERIDGCELSEVELVSILRNWTGGDLDSIALCVGVIVVYIAQHPEQLSIWT